MHKEMMMKTSNSQELTAQATDVVRQDLQGIVGHIEAHQSCEGADVCGQVGQFVVRHILETQTTTM